MLTEKQVLDSINAVLVTKFPKYKVYVNLQKEEYSRPSFAILSGSKEIVRLSHTIIRRKEQYSIIAKETVDSAGVAKLTDLQAIQQAVAEAFASPIAINDRRILPQIELIAIDEGSEAEVGLTVDFFDFFDEEMPIPETISKIVTIVKINKEKEAEWEYQH